MVNENKNIAASIVRRRATWIALLPIAWLQLAVAVHQFDHVADYAEESCHVCVQLDRIDAAVDHPTERALLLSIDFLEPAAPSISVSQNAVRNFDTRAPPYL